MEKKWLFRFSILSAVILLGVGSYLQPRKPATRSISSQPTSAAKEGPETAAFATDTSNAEISRHGGESPEELSTQFSPDAPASRDFSGVTTIDPTLSSSAPTPQVTPPQKEESTSPLPLVFKPVDPHSLKITPEQQQILDRLQQNFLDQIGGAEQDPNDPQYRQRWEEARPLIDQQLKAQLGQNFFIRYETATVKRP